MRLVNGKISSNLTISFKFSNSLSNIYQPYDPNGSFFSFLTRLRLFSSRVGNPNDGQFKISDFDEFNSSFSDDNDKFSGINPTNLSAHQNYPPPNPMPGRPLRGDMQSLPIVDFEGGNEERKDSRVSIRELLNRPLKGIGKEGSDFLEKFKKKENQPEEEEEEIEGKIEASEDSDSDAIFQKMKQTGLIPNAVAMVDGLCRDGLIEEAMKLFGVMREKGTMPEVVVYTAVVEGFSQAQKFDDAKRIFRKMQSNGIVPNAFSYSVLIRGLCRGTRLADAVDFCVEMLEARHSPNVATFTGLVHEFCKEKGVEEAQRMIVLLKQKGLLLDEKAVRSYLEKTGPTDPAVWKAIFGHKSK